nr:H-NS family nucleoid-associated regulatory protein [Burkholderia anthina]
MKVLPARYRDPASGRAWSGRGNAPLWSGARIAVGSSSSSRLRWATRRRGDDGTCGARHPVPPGRIPAIPFIHARRTASSSP